MHFEQKDTDLSTRGDEAGFRLLARQVRLACRCEVLARKAGNVCPGRGYADLHVNDFLASADVIAPVLAAGAGRPLGETIRRAIEATREKAATNTNLGMVLLLAPLAAAPPGETLRAGLARGLSETTVADARDVYAAIRLARPGGLGVAPEQDVSNEPTLTLRETMLLARDRDQVAEQYATDFAYVFERLTPALRDAARWGTTLEQALVELQLTALAEHGDSLILRKLGPEENGRVQQAAQGLLVPGGWTPARRRAYVELDQHLRGKGNQRNPGTTADLLAATLFVALRQEDIDEATPFTWEDHPFDDRGAGPSLFLPTCGHVISLSADL